MAAQEVTSGRRRDGLWAKAIVEAGPDERLAKVAYLRLLVQRIKDEAYLQECAEARAHELSRAAAVCAAEAEQARRAQVSRRNAEANMAAAVRQARREKISLACAALKRKDLDFNDYDLLARAVGGSLRYQGFILWGSYYYEKFGKTTRIKRYKELRHWFIANVVPELE